MRQGVADFPQTGQGHGQTLKFGLAVRFFETRPQATEDAPGRHGRRVSATAKRFRPPDSEPALGPDVFNVRGRRAHVFGWNIAARQRLYGAPQRPKQDLSICDCLIGDNNRLAAAILQAGQGGFIGHGLGETQDIRYRIILTGIRSHTDATQGGA